MAISSTIAQLHRHFSTRLHRFSKQMACHYASVTVWR
jgi:hypothetical protein